MTQAPSLGRGQSTTDIEQSKFAPHKPIPVHEVEMRFYHSAQSFMQFINHDGTRIVFHNHFLATNNSAAQDYLDYEIQVHRNEQLSYADEAEIGMWKMRTDPRGTVAEELRNDASFMDELKFEIENKVRRENGLPEIVRPGSIEAENADQLKLAGVDHKQGAEVIRTPGATITPEKRPQELSMKEKLASMQGKDTTHAGASGSPEKLVPTGTDKLMPDAQGDSNSAGGAAV